MPSAKAKQTHSPRPPLGHGKSKAAWKRAHEAMKADRTIWTSLAMDGFQSDGAGGLYEHRRCPCAGCGSTLSQRTTALEAVEILSALAAIHARSLEAITQAAASAQRVERADLHNEAQHEWMGPIGGAQHEASARSSAAARPSPERAKP